MLQIYMYIALSFGEVRVRGHVQHALALAMVRTIKGQCRAAGPQREGYGLHSQDVSGVLATR